MSNIYKYKRKELEPWTATECESSLISEWIGGSQAQIVLDWNEYLVDDLTESELGFIIKTGLKHLNSNGVVYDVISSVIGKTLEEFVCRYHEEIDQTFNFNNPNYGE